MTERATAPRSVMDSATLARLESKVDNLSEQVKDIKDKLYGNGNDGIVVDQVNQDNNLRQLLEIANRNAAAIADLKEEVPTKFFAKNWRTLLMLAVVFFLFLHSLIPADLSLWTFFAKIFGGG